jgi:DNA-binding CsgD family transcriptional regulator
MDAAPPYLTRFQRTVVWHLSQGLTPQQTATHMKVARCRVVDALVHVRRKLACRTTAQAVLQAYVRGCIGTRLDCGTRASYMRHLDAGQDACPACRWANQVWLKAQADFPAPSPPLDEVQLRILRAFHCGRSKTDLLQVWGVSPAVLDRAITALYLNLGVSDAPRTERRERALDIAQERGLLPAEGPGPVAPVRGAVTCLTEREREILSAAADGSSLARVGSRVGLPATSVSSRLTEIYRKLDVAHLPLRQKRSGALRVARERGYVA